MDDLLVLPLEILLRIFEYIEPNKEDHTRTNILCISKNIRNACLQTIWKPWSNNGIGLLHSVEHGHIGYFRRWRAYTPDGVMKKIYSSLLAGNIFSLAARAGYLELLKMFFSDPLIIENDELDPFITGTAEEALDEAVIFAQTKVVKYMIHYTEIPLIAIERVFSYMFEYADRYNLCSVFLEREDISAELINECLIGACKTNNVHIVKQLLNDGRTDPNVKNGKCIKFAYKYDLKKLFEILSLDWRIKIPKSMLE